MAGGHRGRIFSRRSIDRLVIAALLLVAGLGLCSSAGGVQPPNPNDPCASAGRDICGTTGIGFYKNYQYGVRWFGDYKDVVAGLARGFCIDLGYWYPSAADKYSLVTSPGLRTSKGRAVLLVNRQKMAYAIWTYGRSTNPDQQAAVMLFVHSQMGDARPGEIDPAVLGPAVEAEFSKIAAAAVRYHGPYRVVGSVTGPLRPGQRASAQVRVLSATGAAVPGVTVTLKSTGTSGAPASVATAPDGSASFGFVPSSSGAVEIDATAEQLASTLPQVYKATVEPATVNAQRLVIPDSQNVTGTIAGTAKEAQLVVTTAAHPTQQLVGHIVRDSVAIEGAPENWRAKVSVAIRGPFPTQAAINCSKTAWTGSFNTAGPGDYVTPKATTTAPGWYVFQLEIPKTETAAALSTPCDDSAEQFFTQVAPTLTTGVSAPTVAAGQPIFDRVTVKSTAGTTVTAVVDLFGPFASPAKISCSAAPIWSGSVAATHNGTFATASFTPTVPGVYAYRARIDSTELVRGTESACNDAAETTLVSAKPQVRTRVSSAQVAPGEQVQDHVVVSGSGVLQLTVKVDLFGPYESRAGIDCAGTPIWSGTITSDGDGTYTTAPVTLEKAGYYTFRESVEQSSTAAASTAPCAQTSETVLTSGKPTVTTLASDDVVRPGSALSDRIIVSGLGKTQAAIDVQLYGPFASLAAVKCSGTPYWQGRVTAQGDGEIRSPAVRIREAGFYTFHETLVARKFVGGVSTPCGQTPETSLGAPAVITGRGDHTRVIAAKVTTGSRPARLQIASLGIDAPIVASFIDVAQGVLGVPADIHRLGWWADGAAPGDPTGSIVIAGHVDSAAAGAGALFPLKNARPGTVITVTSADGRTHSYKVVSVKTMLKADLPTDIWSQHGGNRLVVVTCGGPFDSATRHYRDNVVVTAIPV
jgi:Sortase domain